MYEAKGKLINVFRTEKTEKYDESYKIQILGDTFLKGGQLKKEMITLNIPLDVYNSLAGREGEVITMPVAFFAQGNVITHFYPKGVPFTARKAK